MGGESIHADDDSLQKLQAEGRRRLRELQGTRKRSKRSLLAQGGYWM